MISRNSLGKALVAGTILASQTGCLTFYTDLDDKMDNLTTSPKSTMDTTLVTKENIPERDNKESSITNQNKIIYLNRPNIIRVNMNGEYPQETKEIMQTLSTFAHGTELDFCRPIDVSKIKIKNKFKENENFYFIQSVAGKREVTLELYTLDKDNQKRQPISREQVDMTSNNLIIAEYSLKIPGDYAIIAYDKEIKTILGHTTIKIDSSN